MQHGLGLGGIGIGYGDIAWAARRIHMGEGQVVGALKGRYHLIYAVTLAGAQVEDLGALMIHGIFQRLYMAVRQIHHMDVIAHAGTVGGGIIVAEDAQLVAHARRCLADEGHQVVGDAGGVLADQAALMRADGVEVAQQHHCPLGIGKGYIAHNALAHPFGPAIGIGALTHGQTFVEGHFLAVAVHGGGAGKYNALYMVLRHHAAQRHGSAQVVLIIIERDAHGFAYSLQTRKVHHAVDMLLIKNAADKRRVAAIALVQGDGLAGDFFHTGNGLGAAINKIIQYDHFVARVQQANAGVGADIAGAASKQKTHRKPLLFLIRV